MFRWILDAVRSHGIDVGDKCNRNGSLLFKFELQWSLPRVTQYTPNLTC